MGSHLGIRYNHIMTKNEVMVNKFLITLFLMFEVGCVSIDHSKFFSTAESGKLDYEVCVNLNFQFFSKDLAGDLEEVKSALPYIKSIKLELLHYGFKTECEKPVENLIIKIKNLTEYGVLRDTWLVASFLTIGIIPYYGTDEIDIEIWKKDEKINSVHVSRPHAFAFYYLKKWYNDENELWNNYKARSLTFPASSAIALQLKEIGRAHV